ncbi:hypothetical protein MRO71_08805, partial [Dickeya dianthicola]
GNMRSYLDEIISYSLSSPYLSSVFSQKKQKITNQHHKTTAKKIKKQFAKMTTLLMKGINF